MTRINVGIHPSELSDKHLLAEHYEIKRIPNAVKTGRAIVKDIPETFCLGKGHVKFFYDKLGYLLSKYIEIYEECKRRGFNVQNYANSWIYVPDHLMGDYTPTPHDRQIVQERIASKMKK